jgi:glycosyltransferase involved in cell wall biosynthesis
MRILFDLIGAQTASRMRGIGRYTRALALEMARQAGAQVSFALSANFPDIAAELRTDLGRVAPQASFESYATPPSSRYAAPRSDPGRRLGETVLRRLVADSAPDVFLVSSLFEAWPEDFALADFARLPMRNGAAIVYDFIPALFPDLYLGDRFARQFTTEQMRATASADVLLAISECTRQDAIRLLGVAPERVVNISGAADPAFQPHAIADDDAARLAELGVRPPFLFCASGDDPRKNVAAAIEAFTRIDPKLRKGLQLVLLVPFTDERKREMRARIAAAGMGENEALFLDRIDDDDLALLYARCKLFLFPSLYEGFGLPALEAMQCGAAVLVGDNSSLREIVDRPDLRCDTKSPDAIASAVSGLLRERERIWDARDWGVKRARAFSWTATARTALEALRAADRQPLPSPRKKPFRASLRLAEGLEAEAADILRQTRPPTTPIDLADNFLSSCPKLFDGSRRRLLVDVTTIVAKDDRTGIQRVVRNIVRELYRADELEDVIPVAVRLHEGRLISCESYVARETGVAQTVPDAEIEIASGDRILMLDNSWRDFDRFRAVFADIRAAKGAVFSCIYDLIPQLYRGASVGRVPEIHLAWLQAALVESDGMIAISRTVAEELCDFVEAHDLDTRPGLRVGWFHCGSDVAPAGDGAATVRMQTVFATPAPVFLLVGTIEPRKGHAIALEAFERLWADGSEARLMLIGRRGWHVDALIETMRAHPEFGRRVVWFDKADDADLAFAYDRCAAVLAPSYAEGFGLPLAEAAWKGKPVICSDIPVFREIGGDGALYFRVNDPAALADAIEDFTAGRAHPDPEKVVKPTWREAAQRIVDVIMRDQWMRTL